MSDDMPHKESPANADGHARMNGLPAIRPQLVLDVGGVLLTNLTPFWQELASHANLSYGEIRKAYKREMRETLWDGRVSEPEFWSWLQSSFPAIEDGHARKALAASLAPLPALALVPEWRLIADVHVLSNHRAEWLAPALAPVLDCFASLTISSEAGSSKPDEAIYAAAAAKLRPGAPVLFADDKPDNLRRAEAFGWHTLLADEAGGWLERVVPLLRELTPLAPLAKER